VSLSHGNGHGVSATPGNVGHCRQECFPRPGVLPEGEGDLERAARDFPGSETGPGWFCRLVLLLARQDIGVRMESVRHFAVSLFSRMRLLWMSGRPVVFLTVYCLTVGAVLCCVSIKLGTGFFLAGFGALLVALRMLEPVPETSRSPD
jgi:hypothetical protein